MLRYIKEDLQEKEKEITNNHQGVPGTGVLETGFDFSAALSSSLISSSLLACR
jgi:hypothetical protein